MPVDTETEVKKFSLRGFRGINKRLPPQLIRDDEVQDAENVVFDEAPPAANKRFGSKQVIVLPSGKIARSLFTFRKATGDIFLMAEDGESIFFTKDLSTFTLLKSGFLEDFEINFVVFQDKLFILNGTTVFQFWNGITSTTTELTATQSGFSFPKGQFGTLLFDRIYVGNTSVNSSEVRVSRFVDDAGVAITPDNILAWPNALQIPVAQDDGDVITSLKSLFDRVYVHKENSFWAILNVNEGALVPATVINVHPTIGTPMGGSVSVFENFLIFTSRDAIYGHDGRSVRRLSDNIEPEYVNLQQQLSFFRKIIDTSQADFDQGTKTDTETLAIGDVQLESFDRWNVLYTADALPQDSTPAWTRVFNTLFSSGTGANVEQISPAGFLNENSNSSTPANTFTSSRFSFKVRYTRTESSITTGSRQIIVFRARLAATATQPNVVGDVTGEAIIRAIIRDGASDQTLLLTHSTTHHKDAGFPLFSTTINRIELPGIVQNTSLDLTIERTYVFEINNGTARVFADGVKILEGSIFTGGSTPKEFEMEYECDAFTDIPTTLDASAHSAVGESFTDFFKYRIDSPIPIELTADQDTEFKPSGQYTSKKHDVGVDITKWGTFIPGFALNGETLSFFIRAGTDTTDIDSKTFIAIVSGQNIGNILFGDALSGLSNRIVQYRADFTTSGERTKSAIINEVQLNFNEGAIAETRVRSIVDNNRYYLTAATKGSTKNDVVFVLDRDTGWTKWTGLNLTGFALFKNRLLAGKSTSSNILEINVEDLFSDEGKRIDAFITTKDLSFGIDNREKILRSFYVNAKGTGQATLDIEPSFDDKDAQKTEISLFRTGVFSEKRNVRKGVFGFYLRFKIRNDNLDENFEFYGLDILAKVGSLR